MSYSGNTMAQSGGLGGAWMIAFAFLLKVLLILSVLGCQPVQRAEVGDRLKRVKGRVAVSVAGVDADASWDIRGEEPFAAGDSVAVFVLAELFRQVELGKIDLDEHLPVSVSSDARVLPEARRGPLSSLRSVEELSVSDLATLMLAYADPLAVNALIDRLTMAEINNTAQALGASKTSIVRKIGFRAPPENYTTANDVAAVWGALTKGDTFSPSTRAALAGILRVTRSPGRTMDKRLAASDLRISYDGDSPGRASLVHASGVIYLPGARFAVAVLGENLESSRAGEEMVESVARIIHTRHEEEARLASR